MTLVVDELDTSWHTLLTRNIFALFNSVSNKRAQIIASCHDLLLLDDKHMFRRDQIWFTYKDKQGTYFYSLADFKVDSSEKQGMVMANYLKGKYGALPYRSLNLEFTDYKENYYQPSSVVNYPNDEKFTRITEFKYLSNQIVKDNTTVLREYPLTYDYKNSKHIPYYAILNDENKKLYEKYYSLVKDIKNFHLCGRLAEYKYYNMDAVIKRALELYREIKGE